MSRVGKRTWKCERNAEDCMSRRKSALHNAIYTVIYVINCYFNSTESIFINTCIFGLMVCLMLMRIHAIIPVDYLYFKMFSLQYRSPFAMRNPDNDVIQGLPRCCKARLLLCFDSWCGACSIDSSAIIKQHYFFFFFLQLKYTL